MASCGEVWVYVCQICSTRPRTPILEDVPAQYNFRIIRDSQMKTLLASGKISPPVSVAAQCRGPKPNSPDDIENALVIDIIQDVVVAMEFVEWHVFFLVGFPWSYMFQQLLQPCHHSVGQ
jgi:hypothetical protein